MPEASAERVAEAALSMVAFEVVGAVSSTPNATARCVCSASAALNRPHRETARSVHLSTFQRDNQSNLDSKVRTVFPPIKTFQ